MSGIYGFSYNKHHTDPMIFSQTIDALEYWNRIYGREEYDSRLFLFSGIGCHVEHFSDAFPYGGPILNHDGCHAVVDAILYNRDELKTAVSLPSDSAISDEELLLLWVRTKGFDALAQVNGDFAGSIFDPATEEWILFRDHMGVRPLYYYLKDDCFAFSTDLRGLAAMPLADTQLNEMQFYIQVCGTNSLSMQETDFAFIKCIRPGSITRVKKSAKGFLMTEEVYWTPCQKKIRLSSDEAYRRELRRLITDSVQRRCDAISGLLGGELSGGLDSTVIDILIARHGRDARFFSWSPDTERLPLSDGPDERRTIMEVCRRENMTCHFIHQKDVIPLDRLGEHLLPPFVDTLTLGYGSSWLHRQGARVVFTGHGGDEGVSHRGRGYELFRHGEYLPYFELFRKNFSGNPLGLLRAVRACFKSTLADHRAIQRKLAAVSSHTQFFTEAFDKRMRPHYAPLEFTFNYAPLQFVQQGGTRPRMDNAAYQGAFHGVRYLFPYVDYRVMDFALSIPRSQFINHETNRLVFREAFRDILPEELYRKTYKYQASTHHLTAAAPDRTRYCARVERALSQLDKDYWSQYLDLEKIRHKMLESDGSAGGIGSLNVLMEYLFRCALIQDVQKNAKRWREFDEQGKTV